MFPKKYNDLLRDLIYFIWSKYIHTLHICTCTFLYQCIKIYIDNCQSNSDCAEEEKCIEYICRPNGTCVSNENCNQNEMCINNRCRARHTPDGASGVGRMMNNGVPSKN